MLAHSHVWGPFNLYAHAGADARPLLFTHPVHVERAGLPPDLTRGRWVFLDRRPRSLAFEDEHTRLDELRAPAPDFLGFPCERRDLRYTPRSARAPLPPHVVSVLYVKADSRLFRRRLAEAGAIPNVFVGVTDGAWGRACNLLAGRPLRHDGVPRFWITDAWANARIRRDGELYVESEDRGFPYRFRRIARLSRGWGRYARWGLGGATLFEPEVM